MNDYEMLRDAIKTKCASESFEKVDQCIERIISGRSEIEKVRKIKSLICQFEGNLNKANAYSISAISFALCIAVISCASSIKVIYDYMAYIISLMVAAIVAVIIISQKVLKTECKDTFILKALYFKLDEFNNKEESSKGTYTTNMANTSNGANIENVQNKTKNKYRPYNFDEKIEYKIYKNIGGRYRREFTGKKLKTNKKYPDFNTYLEWEMYFKNKFSKGARNDCNFKHYLNKELLMNQRFLEIAKSLAIPVYICEITALVTVYSAIDKLNEMSDYVVLIITIFTIIFGFNIISHFDKKVIFLKDCINIIDSE